MVSVIERIMEPSGPSAGDRSSARIVKWVSCIIRSEKLGAVTEALNRLNLVGGMTVTDLRGSGRERPEEGLYHGSVLKQVYVPKVKIELAVESEDVGRVEQIVGELARTGEVGDGKIFIFSLKDLMRIRTGERGVSAL